MGSRPGASDFDVTERWVIVDVVASPDVDPGERLLRLFDDGVGEVYGYVLSRCRNRHVAEDVTTETFLGAADTIRRGADVDVTMAWLIGIARHKLVDQWRREERDRRGLRTLTDDPTVVATTVDPWDEQLDVLVARDVLAELGAHHRAVLTLRYLDDLPVRHVAEVLQRTEHATEALLVRARLAFRRRYEEVRT